jgi:colanic acid biosynthesis glycosyl transferase WcaI
LETVIEAAKLLEGLPEIVLAIVGEKKALIRLEDYCQQRAVKNVKLLPFQPVEKLAEMYAGTDVGLVIQKKNVVDFNMPSKIQKLLASGLAIIASVPSTGTAARAIEKSGAGLVIPPEDPQALAESIERLYFDRDLVKNLGSSGRKFAEENYSFAGALDRYEILFKSSIE